MESPDKFLRPDQTKKAALGWKKQAHKEEQLSSHPVTGNIYRYVVHRRENVGGPQFVDRYGAIDNFHNVSFLKEIIPELISKKQNGEKVKILDVGAGMTFFTNQIRKQFGDKVRVFSTGLSKQAFRSQLEQWQNTRNELVSGLPHELHEDDLRWRSIKQLTDFEEFDLIIDTYGEFTYDATQNGLINENYLESVFQYIYFVSAKLRVGGEASISPIGFDDPETKQKFKDQLELRSAKFGIKFELIDIGGDHVRYIDYALKITKVAHTSVETKDSPES
jgi:SAM-dependent methyltransferase